MNFLETAQSQFFFDNLWVERADTLGSGDNAL